MTMCNLSVKDLLLLFFIVIVTSLNSQTQPSSYSNTTIKILGVGSKRIESNSSNGKTEIHFFEWEGSAAVDFKVDIYSDYRITTDQVWLFIQPENSSNWMVFGNTWRNDEGFWIIPEVVLGFEQHQGNRFLCRVAVIEDPILNSLKSGLILNDRSWLQHALATSAPMTVIVHERMVIKKQDEDEDEIYISTVNGKTPSSSEPIISPAITTINGTLKAAQSSRNSSEHIYILVRPINSMEFRIFGPAIVQGNTWNIPGVNITDPNQLHTAHYALTALQANQAIPPGRIEYKLWRRYEIAYSREIEVVVEPIEPGYRQPVYPISIDQIEYLDSLGNVEYFIPDSITKSTRISSIDRIISISGDVEKLPEGSNIWLFACPLGKGKWETFGRAKVQDNKWFVSLSHLPRLKWKSNGIYQFQAIISNEDSFQDVFSSNLIRDKSYSTSPVIIIEEINPEKFPSSDFQKPELYVKKIGKYKLRNAIIDKSLVSNNKISGSIKNSFPEMNIYVGIRPDFSDEWLFSGPSRITGNRWEIRTLEFGKWKEMFPDSIEFFKVLSVATLGEIPKYLKDRDIPKYALASSSVSTIRNQSFKAFMPGLAQGFGLLTWIGPILKILVIILLLLGLIWLLKKYFHVIGVIFRRLALLFKKIIEKLDALFPSIKNYKINPKAAFLGVTVLGLVMFAIVSYFPIYTASLQKVYSLNLIQSKSLAFLVITLIALSGILFHIAFDWEELISDEESPIKKENEKNKYLRLISCTILLLFAVALWFIQGFTYFTYYEMYQNADMGTARIMGIAAILLGAIEWAGFLYGTGLCIELFAVFLYYMAVFPIYLLFWFFDLLASLLDNPSQTNIEN